MLRIHAEEANLKSDFTILDTDDQLKVIKEVIKILNIDEKRFPPRYFLSQIENWKIKGFRLKRLQRVSPISLVTKKVLKSIAAIKKDYQD